jgi:HSP20 family protein
MRFVKRPLAADVRELERRMDRLLSEFVDFRHPMMQLSGRYWHPAVDIYETDADVVVLVELPGVDINKVEVVLQGDILHISGDRHLSTPGCARRHQLEINTGSFERAVRLPGTVDADRIEAGYRDGMLTITCPRVRPESISIQVPGEGAGPV